jgi:hypothetical protein
VRIHTIAGRSSPKLLIPIVFSACFRHRPKRSWAQQSCRRGARR